MKRIALLIGLLAACAALGEGQATISVDALRLGPRVSPSLYGIFIEEINCGIDGGLYAEMVRNRGFEYAKPPEGFKLVNGRYRDEKGWDPGYEVGGNKMPWWQLDTSGGAQATMAVSTDKPLSPAQSYHCRIDVTRTGGRCALINEGFWGMGVREGERYNLSLYCRGESYGGALRAWLEVDGKPVSTVADLNGVTDEWSQRRGELVALGTAEKARLVLSLGSTGVLCVDLVSLFPQKTFRGRANGMRPDIAGMLADLRPGFVRFPGGCIVEGGSLGNWYDWRDTIGPLAQRPETWGVWAQRRTHGVGYREYLDFCEDLGAKPMYVSFVGQTCIYRQAELVPMDQMQATIDTMLGAVEYAEGDTSTPMGRLRARDGRAKPYQLGFLEIGNENAGREYEDRYGLAYRAVKAKYPKLNTIADYQIPGQPCDMVDHHYYNSPAWFKSNFHHYDNYDRKAPPVYIGEYAVTSDCGTGNLKGALGEAVFALGFERNADVVKLASYAPLLEHLGGKSWNPNLIQFDNLTVYGTPSYYVQRMLSHNRPDQMVSTECVAEVRSNQPPITGAIGLATWSTAAAFRGVKVEADGKTLYRSDFARGAGEWKVNAGQWAVRDGEYQQTELAEGRGSFAGDEAWHDYTLSLQARKLSGAEGFLICFGRKGEQQYWWNLGGWGNQEHGIELNRTPCGPRVPGRIETGRWYDIRIELRGPRIRCFLDGKLIHDVDGAAAGESVWANAGLDDATGDLIIKAVNSSEEPVTTALKLAGLKTIGADATAEVLTSAKVTDENDLAHPKRVAPKRIAVTITGETTTLTLAPRSFTVLRVPTRVARPERAPSGVR
ncbi:MAG: DUF1080 domain-containing protein [Armatimonadetes bacterium]|nr:DUF1080 domain-containing protein [Armatimonadota bacterium]